MTYLHIIYSVIDQIMSRNILGINVGLYLHLCLGTYLGFYQEVSIFRYITKDYILCSAVLFTNC